MTQNQLRYWENQETIRHHLAEEAIAKGQLAESKRHSTVGEGEQMRSNLANEELKRAQNAIAMFSAQSTDRHYLGQDAINYSNAVMSNAEKNRHNLFSENLQDRQLQQDYYKTNQNVLMNKLDREVRRDELAETKRSNKVNEAIRIGNTIISGAQAILGRGGLAPLLTKGG